MANSESLGLLLRLVHQQWMQAIQIALEEAGLRNVPPSHANVIAFVPPEGIRVSQLTKLAHSQKQTVTQAVEELEKRGYVRRRLDRLDRRANLVFLTRKGQAIQPIAMAIGKQIAESWAALTTLKDMEILCNTLQNLLTKLRSGD
jgi:DNA-binding MarR family transcriptional regulator